MLVIESGVVAAFKVSPPGALVSAWHGQLRYKQLGPCEDLARAAGVATLGACDRSADAEASFECAASVVPA
jgi:hypothetical protein